MSPRPGARVPRVAAVCLALAAAVAWVACAGARGGAPARELHGGIPLFPVRVPPPDDPGDATALLVDGRAAPDGWYCSRGAAPQRFMFMTVDGEARAVAAVGFVPGNFGPDGVGPVEVRVQTGYGVTAAGATFRAEVRGRNEQLHVVRLPRPVRGDHVEVGFLRRSRYNTANCVAEVMAFGTDDAWASLAPEVADGVFLPAHPVTTSDVPDGGAEVTLNGDLAADGGTSGSGTDAGTDGGTDAGTDGGRDAGAESSLRGVRRAE